MPDSRWLWESSSVGARVSRTALLPFAAVFRAGTAVRNGLFDAGLFSAQPLGAPAVSVGNLIAGGTGKTPFASWLATELVAQGARPAILLRGYGGDETRLHALLAPQAIVVADADRVRGATAALERGADVLVLDDAFQHRRAARDADIVLVSADGDRGARWPIPAGPWREPMRALRRARLVVVTCKAAAAAAIESTLGAVTAAAPGIAVAVARLAANDVAAWVGGHSQPLTALRGKHALVVSGIGNPSAFEAQIAAAGALVTSARYRDHYPYTAADAAELVERAAGADFVICTLKDAIKLGPVWPRGAPPLWYLSQRVAMEFGAERISALLAELLAARKHARLL